MTQSQLTQRIEAITGTRPDALTSLSGGCIGEVYRATMPGSLDSDGLDIVAKVGDGLKIEARMLTYLAEHSSLPVPCVIYSDDDLLLMEALESDGNLGADAQHHAAELLASLHNVTTNQGFGFHEPTVIGGLHQPNPWTNNWRTFFAESRLMTMGREAERVGRLPTALMGRVERFAGALDRWITEPPQPSLIHGDMWNGNVLSARGRITGFIDPAIYYADPEIELAFSTLFNTFGDAFFSRYLELRPLRSGFFEERRDIYNLYPLLVHVRLFGGSYVNSVERTLNRFGF